LFLILLFLSHTQGTKVFLNVYDLSPANDCLVPIGMGVHHSGVEILGTEYSFGSGGGVFEGSPKEAQGAKFRFQVEMGAFDGGIQELRRALDTLKGHGGGFGPDDYNLVRKNCNHFANSLCWALMRKAIPAYVNRLADLGVFCSCLLPKQMLQDAPVGGSGASPFATNAMQRGSTNTPTFTGTGHSMAGPTTTESEGLLSRWGTSSSKVASQPPADDLADRREKAREAALARLQLNQHATTLTAQERKES
jgi:hypothetical protein